MKPEDLDIWRCVHCAFEAPTFEGLMVHEDSGAHPRRCHCGSIFDNFGLYVQHCKHAHGGYRQCAEVLGKEALE